MPIRDDRISKNFPRVIRMKGIEFSGGKASVEDVEVPAELVSGHVFIKVHAVGVGPFDIGTVFTGVTKYFSNSRQSKGFGSEFSGVVVSVGDSVARLKVGDEVFGVLADPVRERSGYEYISVKESVCALKPDNITHEEAASLAFDCMIAERALRLAEARNTDSLLITGGILNLSRILTQVASSSMFDSVEWIAGTVDTVSDKEYAESVGIAETFTTSSNDGDWSLPFTSGINRKVYDIVIDTVGDSKHAKKLLNKESGRYVSLYNKPSPDELVDYSKRVSQDHVILKSRYRGFLRSILTGSTGRISYCSGRYFSALPTGDGEVLERLSVLIETGIVTPLVERVFPLSEVSEAVEMVKSNWRSIKGKVVVRFVC